MHPLNIKPIEKQIYNIDCWSENFVSITELLLYSRTEEIRKFLDECCKENQEYINIHGYIPRGLR